MAPTPPTVVDREGFEEEKRRKMMREMAGNGESMIDCEIVKVKEEEDEEVVEEILSVMSNRQHFNL